VSPRGKRFAHLQVVAPHEAGVRCHVWQLPQRQATPVVEFHKAAHLLHLFTRGARFPTCQHLTE